MPSLPLAIQSIYYGQGSVFQIDPFLLPCRSLIDVAAKVAQFRQLVGVQLDIWILLQPVHQPTGHYHELAVLRVPFAQCCGNTLRILGCLVWPQAQLLRPRQLFHITPPRTPLIQHFKAAEIGAKILATRLYLLLSDVGGLPLALLHGGRFQLDTESGVALGFPCVTYVVPQVCCFGDFQSQGGVVAFAMFSASQSSDKYQLT